MITGYIKSRDKQNALLLLNQEGRIKVSLKRFDQFTGEEGGQPLVYELDLQQLKMERERIKDEIQRNTEQLVEIEALLDDVKIKYGINEM